MESRLKHIFVSVSLLLGAHAVAQQDKGYIRSGNKLYREKQYEQSIQQYNKAVATVPSSAVGNYNLGNAKFRSNQYDQAAASYEASIANSINKPVKEKGYYNKGVAFSKQQKLQESIDA